MVVRAPELWYASVMIPGCCGNGSGVGGQRTARAEETSPVWVAATCPTCRHSFVATATARAASGATTGMATGACCALSRVHRALTGGGLVKLPPPAPPTPTPTPPQTPTPFISGPLAGLLTASLTATFTASLTAPLTAPPGRDEEWRWFRAPGPPSAAEASRIAEATRVLDLSGWYYRDLDWKRSQQLLADQPTGTFLVRDSADPDCLFALSVRTDCGPTSVRLQRRCGKFQLDSQPNLAPFMPSFECVIALVQYYMLRDDECPLSRLNAPARRRSSSDGSGEAAAASLRAPLRRATPSLAHLSRLAVHSALRASPLPRLPGLPAPHERLPLPPALIKYLGEYTYSF